MIEEHFTPDGNLLSYAKMMKFVNHQIRLHKEEIEKVEQDPLYYVLHDEETWRNHRYVEVSKEQWDFLKEVLEEKYELLTF